MPVINGRPIREMWIVQFASTKNEGGKTIKMIPIIAGVKVWAMTGDQAIDEAKKFAESQHLPWLELRAINPLDIVESHIFNQPKNSENTEPVQPHTGSVPNLADLTQQEAEAVKEVERPEDRPLSQLAQSPHESQDLRSTEEEPSTQPSLIVRP